MNHSEQGKRQLSIIDEHYDENILFDDSANEASVNSSFHEGNSSTHHTPLAYTSHVTQFNADAIGEMGDIYQTVPSDCKFKIKDFDQSLSSLPAFSKSKQTHKQVTEF